MFVRQDAKWRGKGTEEKCCECKIIMEKEEVKPKDKLLRSEMESYVWYRLVKSIYIIFTSIVIILLAIWIITEASDPSHFIITFFVLVVSLGVIIGLVVWVPILFKYIVFGKDDKNKKLMSRNI